MPDPPSRQPIGLPFIELQTIDSTNNYALSLIHGAALPDGQGFATHGLAIFSHEQTAGKGQRGKKWSSPAGQNIALSIIIQPAPLQVAQQFQLSACIAVTLRALFGKYAGPDTKIKWPNDLYWKDRKAGGILVESVIGSPSAEKTGGDPQTQSWQWAIVGTGININQTSFPPELPNPVSLKQITGRHYDTVELAKEFCGLLNNHFNKLINEGFADLYSQYLSHLYKRNEKVKLKQGSRLFEATIKSVSPAGRIVVDHGIEEEYDFGTIEWITGQ